MSVSLSANFNESDAVSDFLSIFNKKYRKVAHFDTLMH